MTAPDTRELETRYLALMARMGTLEGQELRDTSRTILELGETIDRLHRRVGSRFDWIAFQKEHALVPDPSTRPPLEGPTLAEILAPLRAVAERQARGPRSEAPSEPVKIEFGMDTSQFKKPKR